MALCPISLICQYLQLDSWVKCQGCTRASSGRAATFCSLFQQTTGHLDNPGQLLLWQGTSSGSVASPSLEFKSPKNPARTVCAPKEGFFHSACSSRAWFLFSCLQRMFLLGCTIWRMQELNFHLQAEIQQTPKCR